MWRERERGRVRDRERERREREREREVNPFTQPHQSKVVVVAVAEGERGVRGGPSSRASCCLQKEKENRRTAHTKALFYPDQISLQNRGDEKSSVDAVE